MTPHRPTASAAAALLVAGSLASQGIVSSTLLGDTLTDRAIAVARALDGRVFVAGYTNSAPFLTTAGVSGPSDAFVACLDPALSGAAQLAWLRLLGGSGDEGALTLHVDDAGTQVTVAGYTTSADLATTAGAFQTAFGGGTFDGFVAQLDGRSGATTWLTYGGGSDDDWYCDVAVEPNGHLTLGGVTYSLDYPIAFGTKSQVTGLNDVTVTTLDPSGTGAAQLVYSTLLGGGGEEGEWLTFPNVVFGLLGVAVHVDAAGIVTVGSRTNSRDFPATPGAHRQQHQGGPTGTDYDAFVARIDRSQRGASQLLWATFLGGSDTDGIVDIGMDASGEPVVAGYTASTDFPVTAGAFQPLYAGGTYDDFVTRLRGDGSDLVASTFLGGAADREYLFGLDVASSGTVTVTGYTFSTDFPTTPGALRVPATPGPLDGFVSRLDAGLTELWYGGRFGGSNADPTIAIAPDRFGGAVIAGLSLSNDFPTTPGAFQTTVAGQSDAFVMHVDMMPAPVQRRGATTGAPIPYQTVTEQPGPAAARFRVSCHGAPANAAGFLLVAPPLDPSTTILGLEVHLDLATPALPVALTASPLGYAESPVLPVGAIPAGVRVATQFVWLDGGSVSVSNGLFF